MSEIVSSCADKALEINLESRFYGTLAEIGAGQEVARHLFRVGGAAGTIAKSMSAYDMKFETQVPAEVVNLIKQRGLFRYASST